MNLISYFSKENRLKRSQKRQEEALERFRKSISKLTFDQFSKINPEGHFDEPPVFTDNDAGIEVECNKVEYFLPCIERLSIDAMNYYTNKGKQAFIDNFIRLCDFYSFDVNSRYSLLQNSMSYMEYQTINVKK